MFNRSQQAKNCGRDGGLLRAGVTLFYHPAFDPYFLSYLSPKRVKTVTKGSSRVLMDGAVAPTSPRRAPAASVSPLHPQCSSWLGYLQTEKSVFSVSNNYREMWPTITQKRGLNHIFCVFWEQADEEQKPVDSVTLPPPRVMVLVTTLSFYFTKKYLLVTFLWRQLELV